MFTACRILSSRTDGLVGMRSMSSLQGARPNQPSGALPKAFVCPVVGKTQAKLSSPLAGSP